MGRRVGVIDVGSGSSSLAVFEAGKGGFLDRIFQEGKSLRLIERLDADRRLGPAATRLLFSTLRRFVELARGHGADRIELVATSAMRDAANGAELVARMRADLGVEATLVTGEEEGRLAAHTVVCTLPLRDGVVLDLGGGSLQLVQVSRRRIVQSVSLPLGGLRLHDMFLLGEDPPSAAALNRVRRTVVEGLRSVGWLRHHGGQLVAVGGSARTFGKIDRRARGARSGHGHGWFLDGESLIDSLEVLSRQRIAERADTPGLPEHRRDSIVAAGVVLATVLRVGGFGGVHLSTYGIREGVAFRALFGDAPIADPGGAGIRGRLRVAPLKRPPAVPGLTPRERRLFAAAMDRPVDWLLEKPIQGFWQEELLRVVDALERS